MLIKEFTVSQKNEVSVDSAVVFHDELNPRLWDINGKMHPEIRKGLLEVIKDFIDFIGVKISLVDITVSGSNAAYSYTKYSDIDLHIVAKVPENEPEFPELFDAKKNQYNTQYDIKVKGIDVEVYVQDSAQEHHSLGIYSVLKDKWVSEPKKERVDIDSQDVQRKYKQYSGEIKTVLKSDNFSEVKQQMDDLKRMRKAGLESGGEFSVENLVFKMLRNQGLIEKLRDHMFALKSKDLSIESKAQ